MNKQEAFERFCKENDLYPTVGIKTVCFNGGYSAGFAAAAERTCKWDNPRLAYGHIRTQCKNVLSVDIYDYNHKFIYCPYCGGRIV